MRFIAGTVAFALCAWLAAGAQEPKGQPKPGEKPAAKAGKAPAKGDKPEPVPGRKTHKIEGFTFLISEEALGQDASKYERPPLEVLAYECKLMEKMLSPKAVDLLRRLTVFVNWDDHISLTNGRDGRALASYYGGSPQQMAKEGRHPLQSKTVTIHTLKLLTEQRQPKNDARTLCLLLHEFAHAVHHQLFTFEHAGIKAAYEQAMERKLYERDSYAATNPREFFAELSCAYVDRLHYYPHNRADLKKHDPVTFKTMEACWSGAAVSKIATAPMPHSEKASLDVTFPKDVKLGPRVAGAELPAAFAGKVVVVGYWGGQFTNVLDRLERIQAELGDYGLVAVAPCAYNEPDETMKAKGDERAPRVAVVKNAFVREEGGPQMKSQPGGHALVFDAAGKCVYRGSAYDAVEAARAAVGRRLLAEAVGEGEAPKAFKPVADAFAAGAAPVAVLPKLVPLTASSDPAVKEAAKKLSDRILAPGQQALAQAQASAKGDPVAAFFAAERLAAQYKGTPVGSKASALLTGLRADRAVAAELKARALAAQVEQIGNKLRAQEGSINPGDEAFRSKYRAAFDQLKGLMEQLRKQYPAAKATAEAEKTAREFRVP